MEEVFGFGFSRSSREVLSSTISDSHHQPIHPSINQSINHYHWQLSRKGMDKRTKSTRSRIPLFALHPALTL